MSLSENKFQKNKTHIIFGPGGFFEGNKMLIKEKSVDTLFRAQDEHSTLSFSNDLIPDSYVVAYTASYWGKGIVMIARCVKF